jgi:hypothetical protein
VEARHRELREASKRLIATAEAALCSIRYLER